MGILKKASNALGKLRAPKKTPAASRMQPGLVELAQQPTQQQQQPSPLPPSTPNLPESTPPKPPLKVVEVSRVNNMLRSRRKKWNQKVIDSLNSAILRCLSGDGDCPRVKVCIDGACKNLMPDLPPQYFPTYNVQE